MPRIKLFFIVGILALALAACGSGTDPVEGNLAPDFALKDLSGEMVNLSDYAGHPVLINFWATWCAPCELEMPAIETRFEKYSPNLIVLAVNFDEPEELVQEFVDKLSLTFEVLMDHDGTVQNLYMVRGYPTSIFVDTEGVIQKIHIGIMSEQQIDEYLALIGLGQVAQK